MGLGRLVIGIVGSNPASGMDICLRRSVLCVVLLVITLEPGESTCAYHPEIRATGKLKNEERK